MLRKEMIFVIDEMDMLLEDKDILKLIPKDKPFICLFSGGKDCALALSMACQKATPVALITCIDQEESLFHAHDKKLVELQSKAMNIPVMYYNNHWKD